MRQRIETIDIVQYEPDYFTVHVFRAGLYDRRYSNVTRASLLRAQRAQLALMERGR